MKFKSRGFTSLLLAGAFALASISGIALYVKPKGRVADWTGWTLGGLDKGQWESLHTNACLLLILAAVFHLFLNWKTFYSYLKKRAGGIHLKLELAVAAIALTVFGTGTVLEWPLFRTTADLGSHIKKYWEESADTHGPAPNAEKFTIERFARSIDMDTDELAAVLRQEGLDFQGTNTTIEQIARDNNLSPAQIYTAITQHDRDAIRAAREAAGP